MHELPHSGAQTNPRWYTLDNAAKIYPAIRAVRWASVFRVAAVLKKDIDPQVLERALHKTLPRFPTFSVTIRRGFFWYYLEHLQQLPKVQPEPPFPCRAFSIDEGFLFRVLYYKNRLSCEFFHSLTDGTGALIFMKTLTRCYLNLCGASIPTGEGALDTAEKPLAEEMEDAFVRYARPDGKGSRREASAFQLPGAREPAPILHVTHGVMDAGMMHAVAKRHGVSVTVFLTALLLEVIAEVQRSVEGVPLSPAKVSVPINLRKTFESRTMRNFSQYINCALPPAAEPLAFEEIVRLVQEALRKGSQREALLSAFSINVVAEKNRALRATPLFLKKPALRTAYRLYGERLFTTAFSNLGRITLPDGMQEHIERFDFTLNAGRLNRVNFGVITLGDRMSLTVTRSMMPSYFEKMLFRAIAAQGVPVHVESNWEGGEGW